jgi:hypothetical protein
MIPIYRYMELYTSRWFHIYVDGRLLIVNNLLSGERNIEMVREIRNMFIKRRIGLMVSVSMCLIIAFTISAHATNEDIKIKQEYVPQLTVESVIQMGMDLNKYFISTIRYDTSTKEWDVHFYGNLPAPGFHFLIVIEDRTKAMRLSRGK